MARPPATLSGGLKQLASKRKVQVVQAQASFLDSSTLKLEPTVAEGQTMPTQVYFDLGNSGNEKLAKRISKKLELRADPEDFEPVVRRVDREQPGTVPGDRYVGQRTHLAGFEGDETVRQQGPGEKH